MTPLLQQGSFANMRLELSIVDFWSHQWVYNWRQCFHVCLNLYLADSKVVLLNLTADDCILVETQCTHTDPQLLSTCAVPMAVFVQKMTSYCPSPYLLALYSLHPLHSPRSLSLARALENVLLRDECCSSPLWLILSSPCIHKSLKFTGKRLLWLKLRIASVYV